MPVFSEAVKPLLKLKVEPLMPDPKNVIRRGPFIMKNAISSLVLEPDCPEVVNVWLCYHLPGERQRFEIACDLAVNQDKSGGIIKSVQHIAIYYHDYLKNPPEIERHGHRVILTDGDHLALSALVSQKSVGQVKHHGKIHLIQSWNPEGQLQELTLINGKMTDANGFVDYKLKDGDLFACLERGKHNFPQLITASSTKLPIDWQIDFQEKSEQVLAAAMVSELIASMDIN